MVVGSATVPPAILIVPPLVPELKMTLPALMELTLIGASAVELYFTLDGVAPWKKTVEAEPGVTATLFTAKVRPGCAAGTMPFVAVVTLLTIVTFDPVGPLLMILALAPILMVEAPAFLSLIVIVAFVALVELASTMAPGSTVKFRPEAEMAIGPFVDLMLLTVTLPAVVEVADTVTRPPCNEPF